MAQDTATEEEEEEEKKELAGKGKKPRAINSTQFTFHLGFGPLY
jgi:hypothetical protein